MSFLRLLCLFSYCGVQHILSVFCVVCFILFVLVLCPVYPVVPVSMDAPFLIALSVFVDVY